MTRPRNGGIRFVTVLAAFSVWLLCTASPSAAVSASRQGAVEVVVQTLPPLPGITVRYSGIEGVTGEDGTAHFTNRELTLEPVARLAVVDRVKQMPDGSRARFAKLYGLDGRNPIVAFDVDYPVSFSFADTDGRAVDAAGIRDFQLKSSIGEVTTVDPTRTTLLQGKRVIPLNGDLVVKDLYWTVQQAIVGGSNVVNRSQRRFLPAYDHEISTPLLFFTARFHARDAFFQFSSGSALELQYPDGTRRRVPLDGDGNTVITGLPRGDYQVTVIGPGRRTPQPVSITRNQDLDLKLLSWVDIASVAALGFVVLFGLVLLGRKLRRRLFPLELLNDLQITEPALTARELRLATWIERSAPSRATPPPSDPSDILPTRPDRESVFDELRVYVAPNGEPVIDLRGSEPAES